MSGARRSCDGAPPTAEGTARAARAAATERLLVALRSGDDRESNFRRLFDRYHGLVFTVLMRRGLRRDECQDLTQETFLSAYRSLGGLRDASAFEPWLLRIAENVYRSHLRRRGAAKRDGVELPIEPDEPIDPKWRGERDEGDPLARLLARERLDHVQRELDALPAQMRRCVRLRIDGGLEYRQIARLMGISVHAVRTQLHRARARLRSRLEAPGATVVSWRAGWRRESDGR